MGKGYNHVRVSFKHATLGKYEYDAIGVKDGKCLIVEVKGANIVDDELEAEIGRFASKVEHLENQLPDLTEALGCDSEIESASGLFVFLGDFRDFEPTVTSISLWGYDDFVEALKAADLPDRIVGLLDRSYVIRSVRHDLLSVQGLFEAEEGQ